MDVPFQITAFLTTPKVTARLASRNIYQKKTTEAYDLTILCHHKVSYNPPVSPGGLPFGVVLR